MKRTILFLMIGAAFGAGGVWLATHENAAKTENEKTTTEKPAAEDAEVATVSRDQEGNAVVTMSDELQGDAGIVVASPEAAQLAPELKGYGRVLDPAPLAGSLTELAMARVAYAVSSNELARLNILSGQGNASARALQTAEATALRDRLAMQSAIDRLALSWGAVVAQENDLPGFMKSLTSLDKVLVRIDLAAGEDLQTKPTSARIVALSGRSVTAECLGAASAVDPQTQGRGFIFLAKVEPGQLLPGEAVTGYLKIPGEPQSGTIVPRAAIVRTEGKGWVYVLDKTGDNFTRRPIALEHATDDGWFVTNGVTSADHVVIVGAQTLLSVELKPAAAQSAD